jgi:peroxiredoxin
MNFFVILGIVFLVANARGASPADAWAEFKVKRDKLSSIHQEFEVTRTFKLAKGDQSSAWQVILDMAGQQWREVSVSGSGRRLKIFDGADLFSMEDKGDEYVRVKGRAKDSDPAPSPYLSEGAEWSKSQIVEHRPCGLAGKSDGCVVLQVRLKPWTRRSDPNNATTMLEGLARILVDTGTGLVLSLRTGETIQTQKLTYQADTNYVVKRMSYGSPADAKLFQLPSKDMHEVKELSRWNAAKIKKQLAGKPAPDLMVTDINGTKLALSDFRGKTVLLDFWTTWCPSCREDAPALDKLYRKYGDRELTIIGISVSEGRAIVEQFLTTHPHRFPVVLTSENEVPAAYQVGVLPTYIVIEKDGTVASAVEGDQGFGELRTMLKKAGLEVE